MSQGHADQLAVAIWSPIASEEKQNHGIGPMVGQGPGLAGLVEQGEVGCCHRHQATPLGAATQPINQGSGRLRFLARSNTWAYDPYTGGMPAASLAAASTRMRCAAQLAASRSGRLAFPGT